MDKWIKIFNHRDFVLTLALGVGLILGERTQFLAEISVYTLAFVMVFATTGFSFSNWRPLSNALKPIGWAVLLNYVVFGLAIIGLGWAFFRNESGIPYFFGIVLLAAAPPGPSVIPFATMLRGDDNFSVAGVFGLHLVAMVLTPLMLFLFLGDSMINPLEILKIMIQLIGIPLIISRFLRHQKILPGVIRVRDTIIKWGFFLVIVPIMGMSAGIFFSQPGPVLIMSGIFFLTMYVMGFGYHVLMDKLRFRRPFLISSTLMMVTKSSAFSAVAAFSFFRTEPAVALPSAIVSVFVTLFIIFYSLFLKWYEKGRRNPNNGFSLNE